MLSRETVLYSTGAIFLLGTFFYSGFRYGNTTNSGTITDGLKDTKAA